MQRGVGGKHKYDHADLARQARPGPEHTRRFMDHEAVQQDRPPPRPASRDRDRELQRPPERDRNIPPTSKDTTESFSDIDPLKPKAEDVYIAIMGMTGTGKSTFISMLVNDQVTIGHGLYSCKFSPRNPPIFLSKDPSPATRNLDIYRCIGIFSRPVWLIDSPGFDDTEISDAEVIREIATFLCRTFQVGLRLSGVIYLHRITDPRMSGSAIKNLELFKLLCGKDAFPIVWLVTTRWNELPQERGDFQQAVDREGQLCASEKFWGAMIHGGSTVIRHERLDLACTKAIVERILQRPGEATLAIQHEMVTLGLPLDKTSAGEFLNQAYVKARQRYESELQDIQDSREEADRERDRRTVANLDMESQDIITRMDNVLREQEGIKVNLLGLNAKKMEALRLQAAKTEHSQPSQIGRSDRVDSLENPKAEHSESSRTEKSDGVNPKALPRHEGRASEPRPIDKRDRVEPISYPNLEGKTPRDQPRDKPSSSSFLHTRQETPRNIASTKAKPSKTYKASTPLQEGTMRGYTIRKNDEPDLLLKGVQKVTTFFNDMLFGESRVA